MSPRQYYHDQEDALHTSRIDTVSRCPRKFYIEYILNLEKVGTDYKGLRMGDAHATAIEHADPDAVSLVYLPKIELANDEYQAKSLLEESRVVKMYAKMYLEIYGSDNTERELVWDLPIPGTGYRNCGTIDFVKTTDGRMVGGEDKMYSQWTENNENALDLDDQVTGELYAMTALDMKPSGLLYRVTKKSGIYQRTKKQPENYDEFMERLEEKVRDNISDHFLEFHLTRSARELTEFAEELVFTAEYIDWMRERESRGIPSFRRTPKTCSYMGGCSHPAVCMQWPDWQTLYKHKEPLIGDAPKTLGEHLQEFVQTPQTTLLPEII